MRQGILLITVLYVFPKLVCQAGLLSLQTSLGDPALLRWR